jgi:protein O-GlcNAc transferase
MPESSQPDRNAAVDPTTLIEQGRTLHRGGDLDAAEALYRRALGMDAESGEAHQLLAVIAGQRGQFEEAIAGFRRSITLEGPTPTRLFNLAEAYRFAGNFDAALAAYSQALTMDAGFLDAYRHCAEAAKEAAAVAAGQDNKEAVEQLNKIAAHYLLGLGHVSLRAGSTEEAERAYTEVVALAPDQSEAHNNLGTIALERHRLIEAERHFRRALEIEPESPAYLTNLGTTLLSQVRSPEAAELFRRALEIDETFEGAASALRDQMLAPQHYRSDLSPETLFGMHRAWGRGAMERAAKIGATMAPLTNRRDPNRRLRIAYVGLEADSAIRHCFFEPLVANHDRAAFDIEVYAASTNFDARTRRLTQLTGEWHGVALLPAKQIAERMRAAGIDIAIDLGGHLPHGLPEVFALKPAALCVAWLGYPDTTGLPTMNYRITDEASDPTGAEALYTERLYRMPGGGSLVFRAPERAPEVAPTPARNPGAVTFANFDDPRKLSAETIGAWGAIMARAPGSRLLLLAREFADQAYAAQLRDRLRAVGIEAGRVETRERPEADEARFAAYSEVDIVLDTLPYNLSRAMTCEALWMGVPVCAISGDRPCGRLTAGVLAQIGLERLDSHGIDEYVDTAVELAQDLERLRGLRSGMRERLRVSPLMDEAGFARRFEAALRDMWRGWCRLDA